MIMSYAKIRWKHQNAYDPVEIYTELDDARWEVRKVEVFSDGSRDFASGSRSSERTFLSPEKIPPLAEIAANPEFEAKEISKEDFEEMWSKATDNL